MVPVSIRAPGSGDPAATLLIFFLVLKSYLSTVHGRIMHPSSTILIPITYLLRLHSRFSRPALLKAFHHLMEGDFEKNGKRIYHEHNDKVRKLVGPERLLEYHVKEGWRPLCEFLGTPQPMEEFPRGNDNGCFEARFRKALVLTLQAIFQKMIGLVLLIVLALYVVSWAKAKIRFE